MAFVLLVPPVLSALQAHLAAAGAAVAAPLALLLSTPAAEGGFGRILLLLSAIQLVCELGDARLEHLTFFRHRYSFEVRWAGKAAGRVRGWCRGMPA